MDQATQPTLRTKNRKTSAPDRRPAKTEPTAHLDGIAPVQTLPSDETRSRRILAARMSFSAGDFSACPPSSGSGTDGRMTEAFHPTIGNAERVTDHAARLSTTVGVAKGDLTRWIQVDAKGEVSEFEDTFNTMISDRCEFRTQPLLALTAKAMKGDREKCLDACASDDIAGPVTTDQRLSLMRL